jgi:predicted short-subunit dehydrogenase-like oxidoreductase (DUF2520 family)
MASPQIFVFGAGALGGGWCIALEKRGLLAGGWTRSATTQERFPPELAQKVRHGEWPSQFEGADAILLCVPDETIVEVSRQVVDTSVPLIHSSGALPASILETTAPKGSLHPLIACRAPFETAGYLPKATCAIEGDEAALKVMMSLAEQIGFEAVTIDAAQKPRYHAAAVMASNLMVALFDLAAKEAGAAGLTNPERALAPLARSAVADLKNGAASALTGPAVRGDAQAIESHLKALSADSRAVYSQLTSPALKLALERGLEPELPKQILASLSADDA